MINWPKVDIIVITYNRVFEFNETVRALASNLDYPADRVNFLIADDCSPDNYQNKLLTGEVLQHFQTHQRSFRFVAHNDERLGWGGNTNRALRQTTAPYILQIEDDYVLRKPLNLRAAVALMEVTPHMGLLRFRGTAGDHLVFHQMEANISAFMPDYQDGVGLPGRLVYFLIDSGSPGLYIYTHGLHLKRSNFHSFYGYYPEGLKLGHTEESYAHTVKDKMKDNPYAPVLCIQPEWIPLWLDHIGKSYQLGPLDVERLSNK